MSARGNTRSSMNRRKVLLALASSAAVPFAPSVAAASARAVETRKLDALKLLLGLEHEDAWHVATTYAGIWSREKRPDLRIDHAELFRRGASFDEIRAALDRQKEHEQPVNGSGS